MRGQFSVYALERPTPATCSVAQCGETGDVLCDFCNAQVCKAHSVHLLIHSPMARRPSHKICCLFDAAGIATSNAAHDEWEEQLAIIPRASVAELDPSKLFDYMAEWQKPQ